jgi:hypothetical protein
VQPFICRPFRPAMTSRLEDLVLVLNTAKTKRRKAAPGAAKLWQKT